MILRGLHHFLHALGVADIAGIDAQSTPRQRPPLRCARLIVKVDVGDERHFCGARDLGERRGGVFVRARYAHDVGARFFQLPDLVDRRLRVGGRRVGHRLYGDRRIAAHLDRRRRGSSATCAARSAARGGCGEGRLCSECRAPSMTTCPFTQQIARCGRALTALRLRLAAGRLICAWVHRLDLVDLRGPSTGMPAAPSRPADCAVHVNLERAAIAGVQCPARARIRPIDVAGVQSAGQEHRPIGPRASSHALAQRPDFDHPALDASPVVIGDSRTLLSRHDSRLVAAQLRCCVLISPPADEGQPPTPPAPAAASQGRR